MAWGSINVGGFVLRETISAEQDGGTIRLSGQESFPPSTAAFVRAAHSNVVSLGMEPGTVVPVSFTDKAELTGFYRVGAGSSNLTDEHNGAVVTATWAMTLERVGPARDVEVESRVTMIGRQDTLPGTQTPVFWHAPAVGTLDYFTGSTVPSGSVTRESADGAVRVHTGLPVGVAPRWTVGVADYTKGAARLLVDGERRVGKHTPPGASWEVSNGLVRLTSGANGRVVVEAWTGGAWVSSRSLIFGAAGTLTGTPEMTVLRNDPEEVIIRLTYPQTTGRVTVDLGLRRGSRFATGVVKRHAAATLSVTSDNAEAATAQTGGIMATTADGSGNRLAIGSSLAATAGTAPASISVAGALVLPFFVGHEVGASPQSGDAFADLLAQYLGSAGEMSKVVAR